MILATLQLKNVRIYNALTMQCHPKLNIIIGNNGQGKTTLLESIYFLGLTKSHKTHTDQQVIQTGQEFAKIQGVFNLNPTPIEMSVIISKVGKKANYNHIEYSRLSDYVGQLNVVMFAPEDLDLIKGSPSERRRFIDASIGQLSRPYMTYLSHYKRLLKERNDVLKMMQKQRINDTVLLHVITDQMKHYGKKIINERTQFFHALEPLFKRLYKELSNEFLKVNMGYEPSWDGVNNHVYEKRETLDILTGNTSLGPHRDDVFFTIDQTPVKDIASQGQIRTMAIALKLALVERVLEVKKHYPVVLLDDVFSELDESRQHHLLNYLQQGAQVFMTTTTLAEPLKNRITDYQSIEIKNGNIIRSVRHGTTTL